MTDVSNSFRSKEMVLAFALLLLLVLVAANALAQASPRLDPAAQALLAGDGSRPPSGSYPGDDPPDPGDDPGGDDPGGDDPGGDDPGGDDPGGDDPGGDDPGGDDPGVDDPAGTVGFTMAGFLSYEGQGSVAIEVERTGGAEGRVEVTLYSAGGSAARDLDFEDGATVVWKNGEQGKQTVALPILDDSDVEGIEEVELQLGQPTGGAVLGDRVSARMVIVDDEGRVEPCSEDEWRLCLSGERYRVEVLWRDFSGNLGYGSLAPFQTPDSGFLYFFSPNNIEMLVKVLDACSFSGYVWVFAAATTNVEYILTVSDAETGEVAQYHNPLRVSSSAITDATALRQACLD